MIVAGAGQKTKIAAGHGRGWAALAAVAGWARPANRGDRRAEFTELEMVTPCKRWSCRRPGPGLPWFAVAWGCHPRRFLSN